MTRILARGQFTRIRGSTESEYANVEKEHLFPLIRGRGVKAFSATVDPNYSILIPQRDMHGDENLASSTPKTFKFLAKFKSLLEVRSSYKRFQKGKPYWSLWSTGKYTFKPFKVLWKEMSGGRFSSAYIGSYNHKILGNKTIIPDHKLYFVPMDTENEAAFLVGILNSTKVSEGISAYSSQLSLGVSVVEYLNIPKYDPKNKTHKMICKLSKTLNRRIEPPTPTEMIELDKLVSISLGIKLK